MASSNLKAVQDLLDGGTAADPDPEAETIPDVKLPEVTDPAPAKKARKPAAKKATARKRQPSAKANGRHVDQLPTNLGDPIPLPDIMRERELIIPDDTELGSWREFGAYLQGLDGKSKWWAGDWWRRGETLFGEDSAQALDSVVGLSLKTLNQYRRVAESWAPEERIFDLSWSHYKACAAEWLSKTVRKNLMKRAEQEKLGSTALEELVAERRPKSDKPAAEVASKTHRTFTLSFTVPLAHADEAAPLHARLVEFRQQLLLEAALETVATVSEKVS